MGFRPAQPITNYRMQQQPGCQIQIEIEETDPQGRTQWHETSPRGLRNMWEQYRENGQLPSGPNASSEGAVIDRAYREYRETQRRIDRQCSPATS
jgi:hypothetical protein